MENQQSTFIVKDINYTWYKLKELKTLEDILKVLNALEMSFDTTKVEKYNLHNIIEVNNQNK